MSLSFFCAFFFFAGVVVSVFSFHTGEIEEDEAERLGLVPSHAYAVLDVREINGTRLLQVGGCLFDRPKGPPTQPNLPTRRLDCD